MTSDRGIVARKALEALRVGMTSAHWAPLPHQIPPSGDWRGWLMLAGRGAGKTDACAKYIADHVKGPPCMPGSIPHWIGIIAPTLGDAATSCFSGPSGIRVHSPGARLFSGPGGMSVKWPNGSEAKMFGAHTPEDVERLRSGGNRSIVVGTLIHTERGQVPIEKVTTADRVWTRLGLRPVMGSWNHGLRPLWTLRTRSGRSLRLTPDHKVWTGRGWVRCDHLVPGDTLSLWNTEITAGRDSALTGLDPCESGTSTGRSSFTGRSTRITTGRYPTGTRSTTKTTTSRTTTPPTWKHGHPEITTGSTARVRNGMLRGGGWPSGTRFQTAPVSSAGQSSTGTGRRDSAPGGAGVLTRAQQPPVCSHASCAVAISQAGGSPLLSLAPDVVETISPGSDEGAVWDLTIAGEHEFFAGDLLVSNCVVWCEELSAWRYLDASWPHMRFGLRVGTRPHWIASTTPKPRPLIKRLAEGRMRNVVLTHATMYDNPHLPEELRTELEEEYGGTQLGRQELMAELLDQDENALWTHDLLDRTRVEAGAVPDLSRITVGVDPSGGAGEQGIIVGGRATMPRPEDPKQRLLAHGFVLADRTVHLPPDGWGRRAVQAAVDYEADDICVERNYGGDMALSTVRAAAEAMGIPIPIRTVTATRGKKVRAEPVSALTEQDRWHIVGVLPELENQLCVVAGTLVSTQRGRVPIEQIRPGDSAWTRGGLAPIRWAGQTGRAQRLVSIQVHGCVLDLTPWHKIYDPLQDRFVPAQSVQVGQPLAVNSSAADTAPWLGADDGGGWRTTATTATVRRANSSTAPSMKRTRGLSRRVTRYTTGMGTSRTTNPGTWFPELPQTTMPSMPLAVGMRRTTALLEAERELRSGDASSRVLGSVASAGSPSNPGRPHLAIVDRVAGIELGTSVPVYDLTVADGYAPEFYANGVLVHNCTWHDELKWSPDRLDGMVWTAWHNKIASVTMAGRGGFGGGQMATTSIG